MDIRIYRVTQNKKPPEGGFLDLDNLLADAFEDFGAFGGEFGEDFTIKGEAGFL